MINTNFSRLGLATAIQRNRSRRGLAAEGGLSLIEVMISMMMLGFIVIAVFTGFNAASRSTVEQRSHDQASLLAAQSQEELRSDSAATLDTIEEPITHVYTQTLGGQKYTITQTDRWIPDNNQSATCSASGKEHSNQAGDYLRIKTTVTWPQLAADEKRPALEEASIITPPDGSGLEVDVLNGRTPEGPVAGVTALAGEAEATTGEAGCVIFGGIPATRINIEVFKLGDVTEAGAVRKIYPEFSITPNITTSVQPVLNTGSNITAEFTHEGKAATGDTFVAYNPKMNLAPDFEVGSTRFGPFIETTGEYDALTGIAPTKEEPEPYKSAAKTAISSAYYPTGDLFPFEKGPWLVYAGDCPANNPHTVDESEISESSISVALEPGQDPTVKVPTSEVKLTAYKGTKSSSGGVETTARPVKITNIACQELKEKEEKTNKKTFTPNNASAYSAFDMQNTTGTGKLEDPYQPFGKEPTGKAFKLCLYDEKEHKTYTTTYSDEKVAGPTINLYLAEATGTSTESNGHSIEVKSAPTSNTC